MIVGTGRPSCSSAGGQPQKLVTRELKINDHGNSGMYIRTPRAIQKGRGR